MEYFSKDDVLNLLNRNSITKKITLADGVSIYESVKNLPTADVVPKSEVEALERKIKRLQKYNTAVASKHYNDGKKDVAREIFEEIGKGIAEQYPIYSVQSLLKLIAELKKKYTEEKQ